MTNQERLEEAGIVDPSVALSQDQQDAISSLTEEEVDSIISSKEKLKNAFPGFAGIQFHHME